MDRPPTAGYDVFARSSGVDELCTVAEQNNILHDTARGDRAEQTHALRLGAERHAAHAVPAAVIGRGKARVRGNRRLLRNIAVRGKLAPAVGRIVHIQPLPVGAGGGGGGVVGVEPAEGVELPRCADIHRFGRGGLCLRRRGALGKVGVIVIALAVHGELLIKRRCAGRVQIVGVGDLGGQRQEVIRLLARGSRDAALGRKRIRLAARVGQLDRQVLAGVVPEGDGVAVAHRHAVGAQGIGVRAAEGVHVLPVFAVDLVVDQRAGFKLRPPVAVVVEGGKARIGIVRQTLRHEVIGVARAAGLGGEGV